ncbi:GMC family oxidoreductase N-terminal domain-containing protein [Sphingomonas sp. MMS12-HWE2-04]|uniref:GMC family oxidoreductase N-terminal domain-containing protein n=1 Tax=Sphingomonas sp. MMS12-HWE2-04 TaxID=3234199 RepID=UPI00384D1F2F
MTSQRLATGASTVTIWRIGPEALTMVRTSRCRRCQSTRRDCGVGHFVVDEKGGRRFGARQAYLARALDRPTLTLWDNTLVKGLTLDGGRCTGITASRAGVIEKISCAGEVILAASTVESPKLLMLSGIGPAEQLHRLGIEVRHSLDGVGRDFRSSRRCRSASRRASRYPRTSWQWRS